MSIPTILPAMKVRPSIQQKDRLAALLRQVRLEAGINQDVLAQKIGKPQSFVSRYEAGERRLDLLELRQLCQAMGITLSAFVERLEKSL
jgi:transcriptional regulator with XRE-family HTH domain